MNIIVLTGNATKDIELKYLESGTAIGNGAIAVQRDYKNKNGEYETDFFNYVVMGKLSEVMANHVRKGDKFGIKGKLQTRIWEKDDGTKQYFTEVFVDGFDFPVKKKQESTNQAKDPFAEGKQIEIKDSELPF